MFIFQQPGYGEVRRNRWRDVFYNGLRVGHVFGIEVRLHWLLLLLLAWSLLQGFSRLAQAGSGYLPVFLIQYVFLEVILFGSIFLHELGHCYGSWIVRGKTHYILLWPLGGLAATEGSTKSPSSELLVTLLGPAVNLVLAIPAHLLALLLTATVEIGSGLLFYCWLMLYIIYSMNYVLFFFNMLLPIFPMDAGRVLRASLSMRMPSRQATELAAIIGMVVAGSGFFILLASPDLLAYVGLGGEGFGRAILGLIFVGGFFMCLQERTLARFSDAPIYTSEMYYGGGRQYSFTSADWRKVSVLEFLAYIGRGFMVPLNAFLSVFDRRRYDRRRPTSGAQIVQMHRRHEPPQDDEPDPSTPKAKHYRRLRDLDEELREAIQDEDFKRAQDIKDKIQALKREQS
jgi:Zn-dependent protease